MSNHIEDKHDNESKIKSKTKKKTVPKALKIAVWNKYIGESIGMTKCLCCNLTDITQLKFHAGHIISESSGGEMNIDNLKPICESCNKSMGKKNMDEFKSNLISKVKPSEPSIKDHILDEYYRCVESINALYNDKKKLEYSILLSEMFEDGDGICGNKQSDINVAFFKKLVKDGINGQKLTDTQFIELTNQTKIYDYLKRIDKNSMLEIINKLYFI